MADKFASVAGSGTHDGSSAANAWTMAEATAAVVAGDTVNVLAGTYIADDSASSAVMDLDVAGTAGAWIVWRAYTTTINDFTEGDAHPVILNAGTNALTDCVQAQTLSTAFNEFIGFRMTGASSDGFDGGTVVDQLFFLGCKFDANGAKGLTADNNIACVGCEFTGNTTGSMDFDSTASLIRCKFHNESNAAGIVVSLTGLTALNCLFYDLGASIHIRIPAATISQVIGCTFDGDGNGSSTAILVSGSTTVLSALYNNVFFDCNIGVNMDAFNFILGKGNNLFSTCTTNYSTLADESTDISNSVDPFTNSASRDYTLASGSAARSTGADAGIF